MRIWLDGARLAPKGYVWCKSVNEAKHFILAQERRYNSALKIARSKLQQHNVIAYHAALRIADRREIELIDITHDLGDYTNDGGDGIKLLEWLEETGRHYTIRIHSENLADLANMRAIILQRNGWTEVF